MAPARARKNSSGISIIVPRTLKGLTLAEKATKDGRLYTEEAGLRDLLIAYGFHVLEGKQYAPLRQRLLQHRTTVLREFNEIDKIIVLLMAIISTHLLKFKITKQLLDTSPSEKILRYISWLLSRQKYGKLSRTASFLNSPSLVTSARAYPD